MSLAIPVAALVSVAYRHWLDWGVDITMAAVIQAREAFRREAPSAAGRVFTHERVDVALRTSPSRCPRL
jgi:hypothetical protein